MEHCVPLLKDLRLSQLLFLAKHFLSELSVALQRHLFLHTMSLFDLVWLAPGSLHPTNTEVEQNVTPTILDRMSRLS